MQYGFLSSWEPSTISHIMNSHEREGDRCLGNTLGKCPGGPPLVSTKGCSHGGRHDQVMGESSPGEYDKVVVTKNAETIDAFSSWYHTHEDRRRLTLGKELMSWPKHYEVKDGSLPQGLTVQNMYTELRTGSKNAIVVVRNSTAYPQTLRRKTPAAWAVATTAVPELPAETRLPEGADEPQDPHTPKLTVRQRQAKLFEELDLSGLELWPPKSWWIPLCAALGWVPQCLFFGTYRTGLHPLYQTCN